MGVQTGVVENSVDMVAKVARAEATVLVNLATAAVEATVPEGTTVLVETEATVLVARLKEVAPTIECSERVARTRLQTPDP